MKQFLRKIQVKKVGQKQGNMSVFSQSIYSLCHVEIKRIIPFEYQENLNLPVYDAKNRFYASLGVPEFWRFDGKVWRIYALQNEIYVEVEVSSIFFSVPKERLYTFLVQAKEDEIGAVQLLRAWWQQRAD
ncbi:MAG: hypothetical protein ACFBSF_20085 [Leptolyngbyaceae cyanobacterium]